VTQTPLPDRPETPDEIRAFITAAIHALESGQEGDRIASRQLFDYLSSLFTSGQEVDLTDESPQPLGVTREPLPPAEQTRRGLLLGLGLAFLAILVAQVVLGLALGEDDWARVGPGLSTAATLVAGGLGFAFGHYFSGRD